LQPPEEYAGAVRDLEEYLKRPLTAPDPGQLDEIERGPIDPRGALSEDDVDALLDPAPLAVENGWCRLPDGCGYVASRTEMPGVSGEMVDWWFDWHPRDAARYRVWHPLAHESNSVELPPHAGAKPHWGTVHHPIEDIGLGTVHARIAFYPPEALGFSPGALDRPAVATIVCGFAGDDRRRMQHTKMIHAFLRTDEGVVLRSRFWLGAAIRPYAPVQVAALGERLLNRPALRRRLVPAAAPRALARHCAEEYANLAALLPELHARYAAVPQPSG
jgi:hypothetical protein